MALCPTREQTTWLSVMTAV